MHMKHIKKKMYTAPTTETLSYEMKPVMVGGSGGGDDWE